MEQSLGGDDMFVPILILISQLIRSQDGHTISLCESLLLHLQLQKALL